jgi:hypothetical protein
VLRPVYLHDQLPGKLEGLRVWDHLGSLRVAGTFDRELYLISLCELDGSLDISGGTGEHRICR